MSFERSLKHSKISGDNAKLNTTGFVDNAWTFDSTVTSNKMSTVSSALSAAKKAADGVDDIIDTFQKYNKEWKLDGMKKYLTAAEKNCKQAKTKVSTAKTKMDNDLITAKDLYNMMQAYNR